MILFILSKSTENGLHASFHGILISVILTGVETCKTHVLSVGEKKIIIHRTFQVPPTKPYQDLYIYLIRGPVMEDDEGGFGTGYLGNWVEDDTSFLFFSEPCSKIIQQLLKQTPSLVLLDDYHFTYEEWQGGGLEPIRIEPFVITPPWDTNFEVEAGEIKILLDPGVVFGTGLHPTTKDCLSALAYLRKHEKFKNVLDLGTGTGILSLAAGLLDAKGVLAVDLNPLCMKTARHNVEINHLENIIRVVKGSAEDFLDESYDLMIANIHYEVIEKIISSKGLERIGWVILSGLMRTQARNLKERMKECGLTLVYEWDYEMVWYTMLAWNNRATGRQNVAAIDY